jgi:hypothetical protein
LVARFTTIPLGHGTATITWTGKGGLRPTLNSIRGSVHGIPVMASGQVPGLGAGTASSIPTTFTLADVQGQLGGAHFTLTIDLSLSSLSATAAPGSTAAFGTVTGTFRGQVVRASVSSPKPGSQFVRFTGTIGALKVAGSIGPPTHHGNQSTAHASFTVSRN